MNIKIKIRTIFFVIAALFVVFSLFGLNRMAVLNDKSTEMEVNWLPSIVRINAINTATSDYRIAEALHILSTVEDEMEQQEREMTRLANLINTWSREYEKLISSSKERILYEEFSRKFDEYLMASKIAQDYSRINDNVQAAAQLKKTGILFNAFSSDLTKLVNLNEEGSFSTSRGGDQVFAETQTVIFGINALMLLVLVIFLVLVESWSTQMTTQVAALIESNDRANKGFFNSMTIKTKLRVAFLGLAVLVMLFALFALNRMELINKQSTEIEVNWLPSVVAINAMNTVTSDLRTSEALHVISVDKNEMLEQEKEIQRLKQEIEQHRNRYEPMISSEDERRDYRDFVLKYEEYLAASEEGIALSRKNMNEEAGRQLKQSGIIFNDMSAELVKLVDLNSAGARGASREGDRLNSLSTHVLIGLSIVMFALAVLLMLLFEKAVSYPLSQLTAIIQQLARGNVEVDHQYYDRYDEIGYIAQAVQTITHTLEALIKDSSELIGKAQSGILSARADVDRHPGEFGAILSGMNALLKVLSKPLVEVAEVMQQLALGNLSRRIEGDYDGELLTLKTNVNRSLDALVGLFTELGQIGQGMATGDLTRSIEGDYKGDFSALKADFNQALNQMREILTSVVENTEHISKASMQTTQSANQVADQSAKQLASLDEIANAVTESSSSVGQIADNTKKSGQLASSTAELATMGRNQLIKLKEIIEQIAEEYKHIEQITSKINRIADKTHLLSLNAGVEAVRAGEHGLGFGFVAQQIGKLAEESSLSAREIGSLIANSSQSVNQSVNAAQHTLGAIEDITKAAQDSGSAVEAISTAIIQQSTSIEWISEQVKNIQVIGQDNTSAAEEISMAMSKLSDAIKATHAQVKHFNVE